LRCFKTNVSSIIGTAEASCPAEAEAPIAGSPSKMAVVKLTAAVRAVIEPQRRGCRTGATDIVNFLQKQVRDGNGEFLPFSISCSSPVRVKRRIISS
jgi:hypothetical protein